MYHPLCVFFLRRSRRFPISSVGVQAGVQDVTKIVSHVPTSLRLNPITLKLFGGICECHTAAAFPRGIRHGHPCKCCRFWNVVTARRIYLHPPTSSCPIGVYHIRYLVLAGVGVAVAVLIIVVAFGPWFLRRVLQTVPGPGGEVFRA